MTALHERPQDVIAEMRRAVEHDADFGNGDIAARYVEQWANRLEAATLPSQSAGVEERVEAGARAFWEMVPRGVSWEAVSESNREEWLAISRTILAAALRTKQPAASEGDGKPSVPPCKACGGRGCIDHGDTETGSALFDCEECDGSGLDNTSKQAAGEAVARPAAYIAQCELDSLREFADFNKKAHGLVWSEPTGQAGVPLYTAPQK